MNATKIILGLCCLMLGVAPAAQTTPASSTQGKGPVRLADVRMRDVCILADEATKTYYAVSSTRVPVADARVPAVRAYTSKDLVTWEGPHIVFQTPRGLWGDVLAAVTADAGQRAR